MGELPDVGGFDLFDDDDDQRTVVDTSFWNQPKVPDYPPLAHFGRFEILGRIARGGMAEVYLARDWGDDGKARHLVVKRVLPEMEDHPELIQMFRTEGEVAVRLYHPNVCHVYECGVVEGATFMALEWVWGRSLQEIIERAASRGGCIPWPVAVEIVAQIAGALHYVHNAKAINGRPLNIVHRDVSPHNIMLSWGGAVKLLDFGIAKTSQEAGGGGNAAVGKYAYMSPEQARSQPVDARSDLFALGIVLFEALTGRPLYDRPTLLESLSAIVREPVPSLTAARPELPEILERILYRALAKDPRERFQSAGELKAALKQALRTHGQTVADQRIALLLGGLFEEAERTPLGADRQLSGAFAALTAEGAAVLASAGSESFSFEPSRSAPPAARSTPPPPAPRRRGAVAGWIALAVLGAALAGAGAAAALWAIL